MKVKEVAKIDIVLSQEEYNTLQEAENLLGRIGNTLDEYGIYKSVYQDWIEGSVERIINVLDQLEDGFERVSKEED